MTANRESGLLRISAAWRRAYPGAHAGVLAMHGLENPARSAALEARKATLESDLQARFGQLDRAALRKLPTLAAYDAYYRRFDKTYHVQLQLESIALKRKPIPMAAALVEGMFMAELNGMLLTAGHDLDAIRGALELDLSRGTESYTLLRGESQAAKAGDMMISDDAGIVSSVLYGPDQRTQLRPQTSRAVFTIYAPDGISPPDIDAQLQEIASNAILVSPAAEIEMLRVFPGD